MNDLTEYEVEKLVAKKVKAYVFAKNHEDAVRIFDKLEESECDVIDYDDEYKVDGAEVD
jgi:N-acetyl-gamma-glutamylphosphate reductase